MQIDIQNYIKLCRIKKNILSDKELAEKIGETAQNYCIKKKNGNYTIPYLEKIAAGLDAELQIKFIDKKTGEPII